MFQRIGKCPYYLAMEVSTHKEYTAWLAGLKEQIRSARVKASLSVNKELIHLYWGIGQQIVQQRSIQNWGAKVIEQLAKDLRHDFPEMGGFSGSNLKYMARFAEAWPEGLIGQQLVDQLPWGHNIQIVVPLSDRSTREWYIKKTIESGWSRSVLEMQIDSQAHLRLGAAQNNFGNTLPAPQSDLAREIIKDPYTFDFLSILEPINERQIEKALINHLKDFLIELGVGFAFVGSQYRLETAGQEFFIDLLFYHTRLHCYVVIELKNTDFKFEYTGQLNGYLAMVDDLVRDKAHDAPTIGLLLCKNKEHTIVEYALQGMTKPMGVSTYRTSPEIPKELAGLLPSIESLTAQLDAEVIEIPDSDPDEK
jgi:predicted nuclease of restriction endonuclease-like (RecB) superfamily